MSLRHIDVISVPVSDQNTAKSFYADVLGFTVVRDNPMGPDQRWIQLRPSNGETSIALVTWFDAMPAGSLRGTVLDVDDINDAQQILRDKGVDISEVRDAPWGRFATFSDPDGNGWVLRQGAGDA